MVMGPRMQRLSALYCHNVQGDVIPSGEASSGTFLSTSSSTRPSGFP